MTKPLIETITERMQALAEDLNTDSGREDLEWSEREAMMALETLYDLADSAGVAGTEDAFLMGEVRRAFKEEMGESALPEGFRRPKGEGEVPFVSLVKAAQRGVDIDLLEAVNVEEGITYVDAGDNLREAVLLQIEEASGSPSVAAERLGRLAALAFAAAAAIKARFNVRGAWQSQWGVIATADHHVYEVGLYASEELALKAALEDAEAKNGPLSDEVKQARDEGRLWDALTLWNEEQEGETPEVEYRILNF